MTKLNDYLSLIWMSKMNRSGANFPNRTHISKKINIINLVHKGTNLYTSTKVDTSNNLKTFNDAWYAKSGQSDKKTVQTTFNPQLLDFDLCMTMRLYDQMKWSQEMMQMNDFFFKLGKILGYDNHHLKWHSSHPSDREVNQDLR